MPRCPMCDGLYDDGKDGLEICPNCGLEGSTACCMAGGRATLCAQCEDELAKDAQDEERNA